VKISGVNGVTQPPGEVQRELQRLRDVTGRVAGSVFFGTMLRTMRESGLKGPYGHGGRGEEVFAAQLHEILAERIGGSMRGGFDEVLYRTLERQQRLIAGSFTFSASEGHQESLRDPQNVKGVAG
jgi:hypothetical protein